MIQTETEQSASSVSEGGRAILNSESRTDVENGRRFVREHGRRVRYVPEWNKWLVWDGHRLKIDDEYAIEAIAKQTSDRVWEDLLEELPRADSKFAKDLHSWGRYSASKNGLAHMLSCAKSEPDLVVHHSQLDSNHFYLNVRNVTLNLANGRPRPQQSKNLITKMCPVDFDPDATAPRWERFVLEVMSGDQELVSFLQRLCGYWLTGSVAEHVLPIFYGAGANGKSIFLNTILSLLGPDYGMIAPAAMLIAKGHNSHPTELADLFGKRLVCSIEIDSDKFLAEALVKALTGGESIRARHMHEDFWEFTPTHKLALAANYKPRVRGIDNGIWRRLVLVPFNVRFWDDSKGEDGPARLKQDKQLSEVLRSELSGILNWCLRGCLEWQVKGLDIPRSILAATDAYRAESDNTSSFLADRCEVSANVSVGASSLLAGYVSWCDANKESPLNRTEFKAWLTAQGFTEGRFTSGPDKGKSRWIGVRLRAGEESETPTGNFPSAYA